jgi:hypothetical protein
MGSAVIKIASGVNKRVSYAKETAFGVKAAAAGGKSLRRVSSSLNLTKDAYESKEIRDDYQIADMRHGVRKVDGEVKGELSPKSYADFIAAALRRDFTAMTPVVGTDISIDASGIHSVTTDFLAGGIKVGDVVRADGFVAGANSDNNFLVTSVAADLLGGLFLNGTVAVTEAAGASVTIAGVGKKTFAPLTGHTDQSFTVEHYFSDLNQSEVFKGVKVNSLDINLPPTGMAEISVKLMGQDAETSATGAHFAAPAAAPSTGVLTAVNGVVFAIGQRQQILTGLQLNISGNVSGDAVVGSNVVPELFNGRIKVTGQMSAYFSDAAMRDAFFNETEISLFAVFTSSNANDADFVALCAPRIKVSGSSKDDGEKGLIQTLPLSALLGSGTNGFEATTLSVQDSNA